MLLAFKAAAKMAAPLRSLTKSVVADNGIAMKLRLFLFLFLPLLLLAGCKDLKDQQHGAYVGDSQTKIVYKNVGEFKSAVPQERQVYFRSIEDALAQGYKSNNEAGTGDEAEE